MSAAIHNRRREDQISAMQNWIRTLWPILIAGILFIATYNRNTASQSANNDIQSATMADVKKSIDSLGTDVRTMADKQQEMAVAIAEMKIDIGYLKRGNTSIWRENMSTVTGK